MRSASAPDHRRIRSSGPGSGIHRNRMAAAGNEELQQRSHLGSTLRNNDKQIENHEDRNETVPTEDRKETRFAQRHASPQGRRNLR